MVNIVAWVDGQKVVREQQPEDIKQPPTQEETDAALDALVDQVLVYRGTLRALGRALFEVYDRLSTAGVSGFPALSDQQKRDFIRTLL